MIKPGDNITISREVLIDFISYSFDEANSKYKVNKDLSRAFERCGLNPFCDDDGIFQKYLSSVDENRLYESFSSVNKNPSIALQLMALFKRILLPRNNMCV